MSQALEPEVIRNQAKFLREALPAKFQHFFDCLCETALRSSSAPGWVKCSERLPEKEGMYLALREGDHISELSSHIYDGKGNWVFGDGSNVDYPVSHWMPMPLPPTAKGE